MKIVQLVENFGIGGLPNYVLDLSSLLAQAGHTVNIAYTKGPVGEYLETKGLELVHAPAPDALRALAPDVVHVHLLSDLTYLEGLKELNIPLVRSFHDYTSTCLRRGKRRWPGDRCQRPLSPACAAFGCLLGPPAAGGKNRFPRLMNLAAKISERDIYRNFDAALCGSRHMQAMLLKNGFTPEKTHHIPYFSKFESQATLPASKKPGAGRDRAFELLFSGQAVSGKGLEILIAALEGIKPSWHLNVFSEGPRLEAAKALASEKRLTGHISFNGWVSQSRLLEAYRTADLFILPSVWDDPGPLVGIEAMACGTPVLGFSVGGIPDYVLEGQTGFLISDISVKGLHNGIKYVLEEKGNLVELSEICQKLVLENHRAENHASKIVAVYKELLQKTRTVKNCKENEQHEHRKDNPGRYPLTGHPDL